MTENRIFAWVGTDGDRTIDYMIYGGVVAGLLLMSGILYFIWWLIMKYILQKKFSKSKSILFVILITLIGFFAIFILPSNIKEANWQNLQATCAKQVGYQSPSDNNNPQIATYITQARYQKCLGLDSK